MNNIIQHTADQHIGDTTDDGASLRGFYRDGRRGGDTIITAARRALDLRGQIGWALKDAGWALIHAGNRTMHEPPTSLDAEWAAGVEYAARREARRERRGGPMVATIRDALGLSLEDMAARCGMTAERLAAYEGGGSITAAEYDAFLEGAVGGAR